MTDGDYNLHRQGRVKKQGERKLYGARGTAIRAVTG